MRNFLYGFIPLLIAAISFLGCNRQRTLSPHHWVALGGEFDSLTNKLEWQFNDFAPIESISYSIKRMERISTLDSSNQNIKKTRIQYWKARLLSRMRQSDMAMKIAKDALEIYDSINYEYDRLRLLSLIYAINDTIMGDVKYRHYEKCINFARKSGDKALEAYTAMYMGNLMNRVGENEKAIYLLYLADSLNYILGYHKLILKNKINIASVLYDLGEKNKSDSIMKTLLEHPMLREDTFNTNLIPRNLYTTTGEIKYVYQANEQIKRNSNFRGLRGLYSALLLNYHYNQDNVDSVLYYATIAHSDLPYVSDYNHRAIIWQALSIAWILRNQLDSAYVCKLRYEHYVDSVVIKLNKSQVLHLSALYEMGAREAEYKAANFRRNMITAFIILAIVALGVVVALMLNRRNMRQKMRTMANELELEKAKRKMAATALSIEEKDKMLDTLRSELSDMRREGEIKEGNARRLESTIKSHLIEHNNDETFQEMFDKVNPGFTEKLREISPGLADSYVKLACYILMELDNKRIASLMMIKTESVRQSRWRLSQRLHLSEGENLESYLQNLNNSCGISFKK